MSSLSSVWRDVLSCRGNLRPPPWTSVVGVLVRVNVALRALSDRLPLARQRRDRRARRGDPDQFRAVRQLRRLTRRSDVRRSTYRYHDSDSAALPGCPFTSGEAQSSRGRAVRPEPAGVTTDAGPGPAAAGSPTDRR